MRSKSLVLLVLALGCGLVAAIGINQVMANRGQQAAPTETMAIYVAMKDIPSRETLKIEDLKLEDWPKDKVPKGAVTKPEQIAERSAKTKFYTGEPILETKLFSPDDPALGAARQIPNGYQVVSLKVDDVTGISKLVLPGDNVDVQVFIRRNTSLGANETMTATVLQSAKVFAVNEIFDGDQSGSNEEGTIAAKTVSLVVLPDEAKRVMLAAELGKIRLTLRGPDDKTEAENTIVSIPDLLNFGSGKKPTEDKGGGLLSLLGNEPPAAEPQAAPPADVWTMLVLIGGDAPRPVQFQNGVRLDVAPAGDGTSPAPQDPGFVPPIDPPQNEPDPAPPFDPAADVDADYDQNN
jgi:pilus assembly protein CpaB